MKFLIASVILASFSAGAFAQTTQQPAHKPAAKKAAAKKAAPASRRQAIEEATPNTEPDPSIKLGEAELAVAKRVYTGEIGCELGAKVSVKPMKREGFFFVSRGVNHFVMHPVESRTGAIRLEDPARGAMWLQLANKSMLMSQKEGKRLADECQSAEQRQFAADMKNRPPVNILEPAPAAPAATNKQPAAAAAAAPAPAPAQ